MVIETEKNSTESIEDSQDDELLVDAESDSEGGASAETSEEDTGDDLAAKLKEAQAQAMESHENMLRIAAESENFKKRILREQENQLKYAEENLLKELLPSIDNLERAMSEEHNTDDISVLMEGIELTLKGLLSALEKSECKPIKSVGKPFDPNFHEAIAMEPSSEIPEQSVINEFEKGYLYKDRLLRASKVIVSKGNADE
ncbi:MAG: nucleotide exchange factor GrpE [Desulfobulbaceae bacterium]|nr:nucleotide exchange factor GrpE [Desulfobulbaceae bacterium]MCK5437644.1 nucleotide exchange factor GrpE [Desulfobulbaceae bacterium]